MSSLRSALDKFEEEMKKEVKKFMVDGKHHSHHHPLSLFEKNEDEEEDGDYDDDESCSICSLPILSSPSYKCTSIKACNFILHKQCALKFTSKLIRSTHGPDFVGKHILHMTKPSPWSSSSSSSSSPGFVYKCDDCRFETHPLCAVAGGVEIRIKHRSHPVPGHRLAAVCRETVSLCDACGREEKGFFFCCHLCNFWIHRDCTVLPRAVRVQSHPQPYILAYSPPNRHVGNRCRVCWELLPAKLSGIYFCPNSEAFAHIACATMESAGFEARLELVQLPEEERKEFPSKVIRCYAAATPLGLHAYYRDQILSKYGHRVAKFLKKKKAQAELKKLIRELVGHESKEKLTGESVFHKSKEKLTGESVRHESRIEKLIGESVRRHKSKEKLIGELVGHEPRIEKFIGELVGHELKIEKYHSHHRLCLSDGGDTSQKLCDLCTRPISINDSFPSIYSCEDCPFVVHEACADVLPNINKFFLPSGHGDVDHVLRVKVHPAPSAAFFCSVFHCDFCHRPCNGLCCFFPERHGPVSPPCIDIECMAAPFTVSHASHHHRILFRSYLVSGEAGTRPACCRTGSLFHDLYRCIVCDYSIHISCAMLPRRLHFPEYHRRHPLYLTFNTAAGAGAGGVGVAAGLFCEVCEEDIDPSYWMYRCDECDEWYHIKCIPEVGYLSKVKFGVTLTLPSSVHDHPLTLERMVDVPSQRCGDCKGILHGMKDEMAFFCSLCHFWLHFSCARNSAARLTSDHPPLLYSEVRRYDTAYVEF